MYNNFLIAQDLAGEWRGYRELMADMSSLLKEARDLKVTLENKVVKQGAIVEGERKKVKEVKNEAMVATERCSRTMKRLDDLRVEPK